MSIFTYASQVVEVAAELMNKCPQNPDAEVKKTLREAFVKEMVPKYCNFLAKKVNKVCINRIPERAWKWCFMMADE